MTVTDVEVSGNDFVVQTEDGSLKLVDVRDKVVSFTDAAGNVIAYSYMASEEGTVDGRGISVFEIIVGANNASNLLMASGSGSSLYGGKGDGVNTLQGGAGGDTFTYTNGSGVITNATTGDKINFGAEYQGFAFSNDDLVLTSSEGEVLVQSIRNQVVDVADGKGNFACHVLMAGTDGLVDGSSLSGYAVISGANEASNIVYASNDGSSLYGGNGGLDTLVGGDSEDCFMFGRNAGVDVIKGAFSNDIVNFTDITIDEITEVAATAGQTKFSFLSGAELIVEGNNGVGYLIQGTMYDVDLSTSSLNERRKDEN